MVSELDLCRWYRDGIPLRCRPRETLFSPTVNRLEPRIDGGHAAPDRPYIRLDSATLMDRGISGKIVHATILGNMPI